MSGITLRTAVVMVRPYNVMSARDTDTKQNITDRGLAMTSVPVPVCFVTKTGTSDTTNCPMFKKIVFIHMQMNVYLFTQMNINFSMSH